VKRPARDAKRERNMKIKPIENNADMPTGLVRQVTTRADDPYAVGEIILLAMDKGAVVITALSQPHQETIQWAVQYETDG
jgi:hypothetical protein